VLFVTDIRTSVFGGSPHDIDILWNSALQIIYLQTIQPKWSMLKFRPPFFGDHKSEETAWFDRVMHGDPAPEGHQLIAATMRADLEYVRDNYGLDLWGNYMRGFFDNLDGTVLTQPWSPVVSSECRLFVSQEQIQKTRRYDHLKWENKFMWFRYHRAHAYVGCMYEAIRAGGDWHYDACQDCARELMILGEYMIWEDTHVPAGMETDLNAITAKLKTKAGQRRLHELYALINKYTFFDLSRRNFKNPWHGRLRSPPEDVRPIIVSSGKLTQYSVAPGKKTRVLRQKLVDLRDEKSLTRYAHRIGWI